MSYRNFKKVTAKLITIFFMVGLLSGCINAAMTGAQAVYDRKNLKQSLNDQYITLKAYRSLYADTDRFKNTNISVSTLNNMVVLTGQVDTPQTQNDVEDVIRKIHHVKKIHNLLMVSGPTSILTQMSDTWITTKIKAKLIANSDVDPGQIKVITENGNVYLIGIVPPEQAKIAVNIARTTEGVQNVIKIFSYLRITQT